MAEEKRIGDTDLMAYLDGELGADEAEGVREALEAEGEESETLRSLRELGETLRTYGELEADDAEPALARVWERIEEGLEPQQAEAAQKAPRPAPPGESAALKEDDRGLWVRLGEWLDGIRGHFVTAGAAAAAAAAVAFLLTGAEEGEPDGVADAPAISDTTPAQASAQALEAQPPEVESLEVHGSSGSVLTLPPEEEREGGEAESGGTAVIWLQDEPEGEGPI